MCVRAAEKSVVTLSLVNTYLPPSFYKLSVGLIFLIFFAKPSPWYVESPFTDATAWVWVGWAALSQLFVEHSTLEFRIDDESE